MQFKLTELVQLLGHRIELKERPLLRSGSLSKKHDPATGRVMDEVLQDVDGTVLGVRQPLATEIHVWLELSSRRNGQKPVTFIIRDDANLFYELTVYHMGAPAPWKPPTI